MFFIWISKGTLDIMQANHVDYHKMTVILFTPPHKKKEHDRYVYISACDHKVTARCAAYTASAFDALVMVVAGYIHFCRE